MKRSTPDRLSSNPLRPVLTRAHRLVRRSPREPSGPGRGLSIGALAIALVLAGLPANAARADRGPSRSAGTPTWGDIARARANEADRAEAVQQIEVQLADTRAAERAASAEADRHGRDYEQAQHAADEAQGRSDDLSRRVDAARRKADEAHAALGVTAARFAQAATPGAAGIWSSGRISDDLLRDLGVSAKVGDILHRAEDDAAIATREVETLTEQSRVAAIERRRAAGVAADRLTKARAAAAEALAVADRTAQTRLALEAQLLFVRDERRDLETARAKADAEAAAAAAAEAARARAAREQAARDAARAAAPPAAGSRPPAPRPEAGSGVIAGWTRPITSYSSYQAYGNRWHPIDHVWRLHAGADFGASCSTAVFAVSSGTVTFAGPSGGYGNLIVVDHGDGVTSAYAHMFAGGVLVRPGQRVTPGQQIAAVGNQGASTGCHLHFEIRRGGVATDPMAFLAGRGV